MYIKSIFNFLMDMVKIDYYGNKYIMSKVVIEKTGWNSYELNFVNFF